MIDALFRARGAYFPRPVPDNAESDWRAYFSDST
jgi:hypothetical protein